jgi:hypothetical protein
LVCEKAIQITFPVFKVLNLIVMDSVFFTGNKVTSITSIQLKQPRSFNWIGIFGLQKKK